MRKLSILFLICSLMLIDLKTIKVNAATFTMTTKESLNFEILDTVMTTDSITIKGWAFINENQHYKSISDHSIQLEFISLNGSIIVNTTLTNLSMTSSYLQIGLSYCATGVYFSSTCNYYYEYVGFTATIPLSLFVKGQKYTTNIIFSALSSRTYLKTPLYYPISNVIQTKVGDYQYSVISNLNDTQFRIIETPIYVRKSPSKTGTIWATGTACSTNYSNKLYFKYGSIYKKIISRVINNNQTYYELKGQLDVCVDLRRRIVEGTTLSPVWISGMFVEYSGSPLEINSVLINNKPIISVQNIVTSVGILVKLLDYAKCIDIEDGDISSKIRIESTNYVDRAGIYNATYYVEDKYGYFDRKTITITVKEPYNDPPVIKASDKTVDQYSNFNYFEEVSAYDVQDGDLTQRLIVMNVINTSLISDQDLCYNVTDNRGVKTTKCIVIHIFSYAANSNRFRFVSKNHLFFKQEEPELWLGKKTLLQTLLESINVLDSISIGAPN